MRSVTVDEIHGEKYTEMLTKDYFLSHIPNEYVHMFEQFNHVDTQFRKTVDIPSGDIKMVWRVQGYWSLKQIGHLINDKVYDYGGPNHITKDVVMGIDRDKFEIWSMMVPFKYNENDK
jgi:hypothetical protein